MTAPSAAEQRLRDAVVTTARTMNQQGLNRGRSGNVSARWRGAGFDGFLVTPSGVHYERIGPGDIVALHADGTRRDPDALAPSSEWRFHRAIYAARADVDAVVHVHSPFATSLACHGLGIPPFHYMITVAGGGDIRCAPYVCFGTEELAQVTVDSLVGRRACLLAHHGMIAVGADLDRTLDLAIQVETLAEMYWRALQLGPPPLLSDAQVAAVIEQFTSYGQQPQQARGTR